MQFALASADLYPGLPLHIAHLLLQASRQGYKGDPEYADAAIFNFDSASPDLSTWEELPAMATPRSAPFCGLVKDYLDLPGNDVVVVAGGGKGLVNSTEIFHLKARKYLSGHSSETS